MDQFTKSDTGRGRARKGARQGPLGLLRRVKPEKR